MKRAVFLDRDGVINRGGLGPGQAFAPFAVEHFEILPGVADALGRLKAAGFVLVVCTNQPDVRRGHGTREQVEAIHAVLRARLPVDDVRVCYHDDADGCACRKPGAGMLVAAAVDHEIRLSDSFMVGDRWRDVGAAKSAGCTAILVNRFPEPLRVQPDIELADLPEAVDWILRTT